MFDNPNKELQRLQDRLLEAEEEQPEQPVQRSARTPAVKKEALPHPDEAKEQPSDPKKKADNRLKIALLTSLLLLEIAAMLGVITWWMLWR